LREIDIAHPAAKVCQIMLVAQLWKLADEIISQPSPIFFFCTRDEFVLRDPCIYLIVFV
jgi:hypothetical protein